MRRLTNSWGERIQQNIVAELDEATLSLALAHRTPIQSVHDCRRRVKRARAGLRLLRSGKSRALKQEDRVLADAARTLGPIRDGHVTYLATPDSVLPPPYSPKMARLVLAASVALTGAAARTSRRRPTSTNRARVESSLDHSYRAAWHAWKTASAYLHQVERAQGNSSSEPRSRRRDQAGNEALHDCRKSVKRLYYQLGLLEEIGLLVESDGELRQGLDQLDQLGELLGTQHDFTFIGSVKPAAKHRLESELLVCGGLALRRSPKKQRAWIKHHA